MGVCILLAAGCRANHKTAGLYFISGRAIGLILIGLIMTIFGVLLEGVVIIFIVAFGVFSILLGAIMLYEALSAKEIAILEKINFLKPKKCPNPNEVSDKGCKKHSRKEKGLEVPKEFFVFGLIRGATPCLKLMVMIPLLMVTAAESYFTTLVVLIVFALSSSIYPIIGFLAMSIPDNIVRYGKIIKIIGAIVIVIVGIYVVINHFMQLGVEI